MTMEQWNQPSNKEELPRPDKPLDPADYISRHLAQQQGETPHYGELLESDGRDPLAVAANHAFNEWLAEKLKGQEDLQVERMPDDEYTPAPEDIPYGGP